MAFEKVTIYYAGDTPEFNIDDLDLGDPQTATDDQLKASVAMALDLQPYDLREYVVDRAQTVINLRPSAIHG